MVNLNNQIKGKLSNFFQKNNRFIVAILQIGRWSMFFSAVITISFYGLILMEKHDNGIISGLSMQQGIAAMLVIFVLGTCFSIYGWKSMIASAKQLA